MSIYKKLLEAKKEMNAITKDSQNPFFKSKYFDVNKLLSEVEPILQKHGLLLLQPIQEGKVYTMIYDSENGDDFIDCEISLPNIQDPQKLGSAITYFRRYTLQSLLGLQAEDDDANSASKHVNNSKPKMFDVQTPVFSEANFEKAKLAGATIDKIKSIYTISKETEQKYLEYVAKK